MERFASTWWAFPVSMTGIGILSYYHTLVKPALWGFLAIAILYRIFAYTLWRLSDKFHNVPVVAIDPPINDDNEEDQAVPPAPAHVRPTRAKNESEAVAWVVQHAKDQNAGYLTKKIYRLYELWVPLIMRIEDDKGVPLWFSVMQTLSRSSVLVIVVAVSLSLAATFSYKLAQEPILGLINCDKEMIDAALHCDPYTESCHLTPPCGPHDVNYAKLVETYHDRCVGNAYPKIAMIKNVCFMEKDGNNDNNSWRHVWMKLVGSDFYSLEHTLISFYRSNVKSPNELRELVNQPVRVFYDQIGTLVGYGVNTITPTGVERTNIDHDDLMTTLTTWRNKKLTARVRENPCICAAHLGILNRMLFMWEDDINMWQIYLDHNISRTNSVFGSGDLVPTYYDFPRNVDAEIAASVRGEKPGHHYTKTYPRASTIDVLRVNTAVSNSRSMDIQTTQQIRRHWSLEGPVLQSQIPHVYFDASLDAYRHANDLASSGMSRGDGEIKPRHITDKAAACYYQCSRIFDEVE